MAVAVCEVIDEPIGDLWDLIGNFGHLERWHPDVRSCTLQGEGVGAVRTVRFADDMVEERLERVDPEAHSIAYAVTGGTRLKMIGLGAVIELTALSAGRTRIEWRAGTGISHPHALELDAFLAVLYPARIQHLRDSAGLRKGSSGR